MGARWPETRRCSRSRSRSSTTCSATRSGRARQRSGSSRSRSCRSRCWPRSCGGGSPAGAWPGSSSSWARRPSPRTFAAALARALGDPSLDLAYWFPAEARYVTGDGRPVQEPGADSGRRSTVVERDGTPIAMLLHDPALEHNSGLVQSVCAAAGLALENERLQAELRARLVELNASRGRLVEATDAERRRIERNLHDGTQQRLVSIAMSLGLLESKLAPDQDDAAPIVREARDGAGARARGAARADPGHPPDAAGRARASGGARGAVPARRPARAPQGRPRRPASRPGRDRRVLLRQRGAEQRGQALARKRGQGRASPTTGAR